MASLRLFGIASAVFAGIFLVSLPSLVTGIAADDRSTGIVIGLIGVIVVLLSVVAGYRLWREERRGKLAGVLALIAAAILIIMLDIKSGLGSLSYLMLGATLIILAALTILYVEDASVRQLLE
jgi:drug/metabolite transporter (DMT)-like permease